MQFPSRMSWQRGFQVQMHDLWGTRGCLVVEDEEGYGGYHRGRIRTMLWTLFPHTDSLFYVVMF